MHSLRMREGKASSSTLALMRKSPSMDDVVLPVVACLDTGHDVDARRSLRPPTLLKRDACAMLELTGIGVDAPQAMRAAAAVPLQLERRRPCCCNCMRACIGAAMAAADGCLPPRRLQGAGEGKGMRRHTDLRPRT